MSRRSSTPPGAPEEIDDPGAPGLAATPPNPTRELIGALLLTLAQAATLSWSGAAGSVLAESRPGEGRDSGESVDLKGRTCTESDCHADLQLKRVLHGPVAQEKCNACHHQQDPGVHAFQFVGKREDLCQGCHIVQLRNFIHTPVREGKCESCHDPHQSDHRFMLREDPAEKLCLSCHEDASFLAEEHVHAPVSAGACILCHESHSSWNPQLLIQEGRELCIFCHEDVDQALVEARHVHSPVADDCGACHDPHGSSHAANLRGPERDLCVSCHRDVGALIETSDHVHGAITADGSCSNCHSGHTSSMPRLLRRSLLDTCLGCHDQEIELPDGRRVGNMVTLLRDNPDHHGPVRRADCSACHNPHASPNFGLLSSKYPKLFYAPFDLSTYDLCFQCHLREMVLVENARGVTRFRNGNLNLHYVHVNKEDKGRTCRACHEVHASKNPLHIRERVPFGPNEWELEIHFKKTETGGSCAPGCHKEMEYVRSGDDVPLPGREVRPGDVSAPQDPRDSDKEGRP